MRVSKAPQERKQEMIDTAIRLFSERGYEATTMSDIAKAMNVVPGLCYKYFSSKEDLYRCVSEQYAERCAAPTIELLCKDYSSMNAFFEAMGEYVREQSRNMVYHEFYHNTGNEIFHQQLNAAIAEKICEPMAAAIRRYSEQSGKMVAYPEQLARFLCYGMGSVLDDSQLTADEKTKLCIEIVGKLLD